MTAQLKVLKAIPEGFFTVHYRNIKAVFPQPTLLELKGAKKEPLFISILLHGNEYSGLIVMQQLLRKYQQQLPRSLYLFIGNVEAATADKRCLQDQTDFNRAWPGTTLPPDNTTRLMREVIDYIRRQPLFAAIDIHNNTGTNPHYGCITDIRKENQYICSLFNHIAFVFHYPKGVSTGAFDGICPAVTLETGKPGEPHGVQHTLDLVEALLHLDHFPERATAKHDLQLVASFATVIIKPEVSFSFGDTKNADLVFDKDFEYQNFTEITPEQVFAKSFVESPFTIKDQNGEEITEEVIRREGENIYLNRTLMPAMITKNKEIIRQDCLCYLLTDYQS